MNCTLGQLNVWCFQFDELKLESQGYLGSLVPQRGVQWGLMLRQAEKRVGSTGIAAEVVVGILVSLSRKTFNGAAPRLGACACHTSQISEIWPEHTQVLAESVPRH